ncbi:mycofactocin-coupled SDR family oxidoreductase [Nocardioides sp.]|uniref:mycofactocin-coupled SDR family oxidoreductase n=1 Tax=Nocardioides sp. TaxID=35761 RepID=UPI003D0E477E
MRVEGKVAFITGVARGQGRSHAIRLAQEGADIIGVDLLEEIPGAPYGRATEQDLAETVRAVEAAGRRILATQADVRDITGLRKAVDDGVTEFGRLDIVSANAGIFTQMAPSEELDEDIWHNMIDTNLTGVWHTAKAAIPHMKAAGNGGTIVITGSQGSIVGFGNIAHYVSAKHGVVGLMRTLALELAPWSIRVNAVLPTQVDTDLIMNDATYKLFSPDVEHPTRDDFAPASQALHALPVPWVESVDVSNAVLFLASDEARYITGAMLPVDAGAAL